MKQGIELRYTSEGKELKSLKPLSKSELRKHFGSGVITLEKSYWKIKFGKPHTQGRSSYEKSRKLKKKTKKIWIPNVKQD